MDSEPMERAHHRFATSGRAAPDIRRVFELVHEWIVRQPSVDVRVVPVNGSPIAYVWQAPHRRPFVGSPQEEQLWNHITTTLWPATDGDHADRETSVEAPVIEAPVFAAARRQPKVFPEVEPIPLDVQREDIVRLSALAEVPIESWPSVPTPMPAVRESVRQAWAGLPDDTLLRVSDALRRVGWTMPIPSYLLVTICAQRLVGWRWDTRGPFPKAAALCLRRAAWALRALHDAHPLYRRLQGMLRADGDRSNPVAAQ